METLETRLYDAEAKVDMLFFALRSLLELQNQEMRLAFMANFQNSLDRAAEIGLATVAPDRNFKELQHQGDHLVENLG